MARFTFSWLYTFSPNKRDMKFILKVSTIGGVIVVAIILLSYYWVERSSKNKLFDSVDSISENEVGLVLGTSKYGSSGYMNLYFIYRVRAAAQLYHSGKVQYLLVSGDNSRKDYSEPEDMQTELIMLGVPENRIFLDHAGFRTLDSVERSKVIFGQSKLTIISQPFHNKRAVFIAKHKGIDAIAFNAKDVSFSFDRKAKVREYIARVKMVLDLYVLNTKPKFYGESIKIADNDEAN